MNNTSNFVVICIKCGGNYKRVDVMKLEVISGFEGQEIPKNIYICNTCYEEIPGTDEGRRMEVVKVRDTTH